MTSPAKWAAETARIIIEGRSLYTRTTGDPFYFSSGWASPVFIDCKKLISDPRSRNALVDMAVERISASVDIGSLDAVAGCELTGVPFATLIADRLGKPLVLVCKQSKGFGRLAQFEGSFEPGARVLLVDDLATDGVSETVFRTALQRADAAVLDTFVLIDFDVFPSEHTYLSLAKLGHIIGEAKAQGYLGPSDVAEIEAFAADAPAWSRLHGGIAAYSGR
jgi:orotate phosphoribosyltransferase